MWRTNLAYVKGVTYVTYFADWGDTLFEIHNWDLENSDTFDKSNKKKYFKD